jgi:hypothetical protein
MSDFSRTGNTPRQDGTSPRIKKAEVVPMILAKCPTFIPMWERYQALLRGKEAGIYNDLGEFAAFVIAAYVRKDTESIAAAFAVIEELMVRGDEEVRAAAAIGFLTDVRNAASWRPFGASAFTKWLGPESKEAWAYIEGA